MSYGPLFGPFFFSMPLTKWNLLGKPVILGTDDLRLALFACATEAFFERSTRLKKECQSIYTALRSFYQLDPANWDIPT